MGAKRQLWSFCDTADMGRQSHPTHEIDPRGFRTQWHPVTFNLGGCQNALTLFYGASLAAGSYTSMRTLIGRRGFGLSRCSCQTWLTAVEPEIAFNTVPLTSCMPSLTPHLMFFCSFTKSIWQNWQTGGSQQTWVCQTQGAEVWSSGISCVVVYK